ncbi:MAG: hypothetical protein ACOYK8_01640 [Alphaproteobacteria bacterium]
MKPISVIEDIQQRPITYVRDIAQCGASWFSLGNMAYAAATGVVGGFALGGGLASLIQLGITAEVWRRQAKATHDGKNFSSPFDLLAKANYASAALLAITAVAAGTQAIAAAALPVAMFVMWGKGHEKVARFIKRSEQLQRQGMEDINSDPQLVKLVAEYQGLYGAGDLLAVIKGKPFDQLSEIITQPLANLDSLAPAGIFAIGLHKAFNHSAKPEKITPNHCYSAAYVLGGLLSLSQPGFAAAQFLWACAYGSLETKHQPPQTAEQYRATHRKIAR